MTRIHLTHGQPTNFVGQTSVGGVDSFGLQSFCLFEPPELNKTRIMSKKSTPAIGEKKGLRMFIVLVLSCWCGSAGEVSTYFISHPQ